MNAKTYNKFKTQIIKACDKRVKEGKKIASGIFFVGDACCPIACLVGVDEGNPGNFFSGVDKKLKITVPVDQYWDFIDGFDGHDPSTSRKVNKQLFKLGRALNKKYITKE